MTLCLVFNFDEVMQLSQFFMLDSTFTNAHFSSLTNVYLVVRMFITENLILNMFMFYSWMNVLSIFILMANWTVASSLPSHPSLRRAATSQDVVAERHEPLKIVG